MKIGIMQPYFFPYLGYWQLINCVDIFVILDDVAYIKGGWINRNKILMNGRSVWYNIPISKASSNKMIKDHYVKVDLTHRSKLLMSLKHAYHKAPYFDTVYPMIQASMNSKEKLLSKYLVDNMHTILDYLEIQTPLVLSSDLLKNNCLKGEARIIEICKSLKANEYYNPIGGMSLYSFDSFKKHAIDLSFLKMGEISYAQMNHCFVPNLSIIDVMMFQSKDEIKSHLMNYQLITRKDSILYDK